jgi:hypothetical protein
MTSAMRGGTQLARVRSGSGRAGGVTPTAAAQANAPKPYKTRSKGLYACTRRGRSRGAEVEQNRHVALDPYVRRFEITVQKAGFVERRERARRTSQHARQPRHPHLFRGLHPMQRVGPIDAILHQERRAIGFALPQVVRAHQTGNAQARQQRKLRAQLSLGQQARSVQLRDECALRVLAVAHFEYDALRAAPEHGSGAVTRVAEAAVDRGYHPVRAIGLAAGFAPA